jgi:FixJ family two-component response regulator
LRLLPMEMHSVFVVDDDESYRELVQLTLEDQCGVASVQGFDGAGSLLRHLAQAQDAPSMLLLDLHLQGETGMDLLQQLRSRGVQAPIAFLSGAAAPEERAACMAAGAVAFLSKPVAYADLVQALRELVASVDSARAGKG